MKNLDDRIGMCFDFGHNLRQVKDPVRDLEKYHSRIFDIHNKDIIAARKPGCSVEIGHGMIGYPSFIRMLRQVGYTGVRSLQHGHDTYNPFVGVAESVGYFRGVLVSTC